MDWTAHLMSMIPFTALVVVTGRVVLAWLPPGPIGSHRAAEIGTTLVVSGMLGTTLAVLIGLWSAQVGVEFPTYVGWVLIGVPLAARLATAPGTLVPRHAPARERGGPAAQLLTLAIVGVVVWRASTAAGARFAYDVGATVDAARQPLWARSWAFGVAGLVVVPIAVELGLRTARRTPVERRLIVLAAALTTPFLASLDVTHARSAFVLGTACAIAWWRRADRRALALAAIFFGSCAGGFRSVALAIAGSVALVLFTAPSSRRRATAWASASVVLVGAVLGFREPLERPEIVPLDAFDLRALPVLGAALFAAAALALSGRSGRNRAPVSPAGIDEPRRSIAAIGTALALGASGLMLSSQLGWLRWKGLDAWVPAALILAPTAWLWIGLVGTRAERPPGSTDAG